MRRVYHFHFYKVLVTPAKDSREISKRPFISGCVVKCASFILVLLEKFRLPLSQTRAKFPKTTGYSLLRREVCLICHCDCRKVSVTPSTDPRIIFKTTAHSWLRREVRLIYNCDFRKVSVNPTPDPRKISKTT